MAMVLSILAGLSLAIWIYLTFFHGNFWRAGQRIGEDAVEPQSNWPGIVAVVPARNEADVVGHTIASLLAQDYPMSFPIVLVDDGSDDGTQSVARAAAAGAEERLVVVRGAPMQPGWVGKVWAMAQGVSRVDQVAPDARYILFSDADIAHEPSNLRRMVVRAEGDRVDLASIMVMLAMHGIWERLLIPPFIFFFQLLYPFAHVNEGRRYAAAGGCMLVRRSALDDAGGLESIRDALIDDCALARQIGTHGGKLWLGLSSQTHSTRPYGGLAGVWNMVARSAYTQLDYSLVRLAGTVLGMFLTYIVPPLAVFGYFVGVDPFSALTGGLALILMIGVYWPTVRLYRQSVFVALFLPIAAVLYTGMTIDSARRYWLGAGGGWKGRVYSRRTSRLDNRQ